MNLPKIYAVPDIHGRLDLLVRAWDKIPLQEQDQVIFMGDMIDRGPDSKGVVEMIMELQEGFPNQVIVLLGNHELFMLDALRKGEFDGWTFPGNGGLQTLKSFGVPLTNFRSAKDIIPEKIIKWIENLPSCYVTNDFFFSHAPIEKWDEPPFTQHQLTWNYFQNEKANSYIHPGKVGVCGHIHRLQYGDYTPRYYEHYLFLDAGCGCHERAPLVVTEVTQRKPIWIWPGEPIVPKNKIHHPKLEGEEEYGNMDL